MVHGFFGAEYRVNCCLFLPERVSGPMVEDGLLNFGFVLLPDESEGGTKNRCRSRYRDEWTGRFLWGVRNELLRADETEPS